MLGLCSEVKLSLLKPATGWPEAMIKQHEEIQEKLMSLMHNVVLLKDNEADAYTPVGLLFQDTLIFFKSDQYTNLYSVKLN